MDQRGKQLREQFKALPPGIQAALNHAFKKLAEDMADKESRTAKSLAALCAFAQDPKKGRRALEVAFIEDPVVRKTVCEVIRKGRMAKRAAERKAGLSGVESRRDALRIHRGDRPHR
jgi:hypothetical protein